MAKLPEYMYKTYGSSNNWKPVTSQQKAPVSDIIARLDGKEMHLEALQGFLVVEFQENPYYDPYYDSYSNSVIKSSYQTYRAFIELTPQPGGELYKIISAKTGNTDSLF